MVSTETICRSGQNIIFTQQKPSQHVFVDVYFTDMQYLLISLRGISLWNFPSPRHVQKKNRPEKFPFIATNNCIVSQSQETDSLETRAELAALRIYVENQAILEPIPLYQASKCKQTKEQGSEDSLWTHIFTFL